MKGEEASSETLHNPARVVPAQAKFIHFQEGLGVRYTPIKAPLSASGIVSSSGIVMLKDLCPDLPVELVQVSTPAATAPAAGPTPVEEEEPPPPEPFEYVPQ
jgi:26S proteasome regulatory subunit N2